MSENRRGDFFDSHCEFNRENKSRPWTNPDLGSVFQAGHRRVVRWFAGRVLCCKDQIAQCRRDILDGVDQQNLNSNNTVYLYHQTKLFYTISNKLFYYEALLGSVARHLYVRLSIAYQPNQQLTEIRQPYMT